MAVWARPWWEWTQNVMIFLLLPTASSMVMGRGIQLELQPSPLNSSPSYCTSKPIWQAMLLHLIYEVVFIVSPCCMRPFGVLQHMIS
jgi:hypothetical protein